MQTTKIQHGIFFIFLQLCIIFNGSYKKVFFIRENDINIVPDPMLYQKQTVKVDGSANSKIYQSIKGVKIT